MIETSKNEILKGKIVSDFLSNNKFAAECYFNDFYEEINTAWLNKNDIILYISPEYKDMMFLNSESEKNTETYWILFKNRKNKFK